MRKTSIILLCLLAILTVFVSCSEGLESDLATVRLSINNDRSRTISSNESDSVVTKYKFKLDNQVTTDAQYEFTYDKTQSGTYEIKGILPGRYTVIVSGLNSSGTTLTSATKEFYFSKGTNSFSITLSELSGTGSFTVNLIWNKEVFNTGSDVITPTVEIDLTTEDGTKITDFTIDSSHVTEGRATISKSGLNSGSYILIVKIKGESSIFFGSADVIRITPNSNVEGTIDYSKSGTLEVTGSIVDNTSSPLKGTIVPDKIYNPGDTRNGSVTFTLQIENLPEGKSLSDVNVRWFGEDYEDKGKNSTTYLCSPYYGTARYTAIMWIPGIKGSMGSAELIYYAP